MDQAIITLTTDFGTRDAYVAEMKAVILGINPTARIVDVSHDIEPQNLVQAAFVLSTASPCFPDGSIHVVVVDPGVGTRRRAIIIEGKSGLFVCPDNGIIGHLFGARPAASYPGSVKVVRLPTGFSAYAITESRFWHQPVSTTFHGRDVFAPVAAHLSIGVPPHEFGKRLSRVHALLVPAPRRLGGKAYGHVLHIDRFGNIITSLRQHDLPRKPWQMEIGGHRLAGLSRSYRATGGIGALVGSSGYIEIAADGRNAALELDVRVGDKVTATHRARQQ